MAYFKVLPQHLSQQSVSSLIFEPGPPEYEARVLTTQLLCSVWTHISGHTKHYRNVWSMNAGALIVIGYLNTLTSLDSVCKQEDNCELTLRKNVDTHLLF